MTFQEVYEMSDDDIIFEQRLSILDDVEETTNNAPPAGYNTVGTILVLDELHKVGEILVSRGKQYQDSYLMGGRFGLSARDKLLARLEEKVYRLENCFKTGADEADTLRDIVGYSLLLLAEKKYREG